MTLLSEISDPDEPLAGLARLQQVAWYGDDNCLILDTGIHGQPATPGRVYGVQIAPGFAPRRNQGLDIALEAANTHPWGLAADLEARTCYVGDTTSGKAYAYQLPAP